MRIVENNSKSRTGESPLRIPFFLAMAVSIVGELGSERFYQIFRPKTSLLWYGEVEDGFKSSPRPFPINFRHHLVPQLGYLLKNVL